MTYYVLFYFVLRRIDLSSKKESHSSNRVVVPLDNGVDGGGGKRQLQLLEN